MSSPDLLTIEEAAEATGRHPDLLRRWARAGTIPAVRLGHAWVIRADDLEAIRALPRRTRPRA